MSTLVFRPRIFLLKTLLVRQLPSQFRYRLLERARKEICCQRSTARQWLHRSPGKRQASRPWVLFSVRQPKRTPNKTSTKFHVLCALFDHCLDPFLWLSMPNSPISNNLCAGYLPARDGQTRIQPCRHAHATSRKNYHQRRPEPNTWLRLSVFRPARSKRCLSRLVAKMH
jgi:hypothetical protein